MTSKGITKQELNNDILQELNKIDKQFAEDTTKDLTEIKETNEKQQKDIDKMMGRLTFMTCRRSSKLTSGLFKQIRWYDVNNKIYALSDVNGDTSSNGDFTPKTLSIHFYKDNAIFESYIFSLIFDADGDLERMELISHA
ncbi:hypothetical protein CF095_18415 [Clostridium botulinum]